jgi:hypothetical protein
MINAVIVEPRLHKYLEPVIDNIIKNLPSETIIYIFHGIINKHFLESKYKNNQNIVLINLNVKNLTVREYSDMLTTVNFWEQITGDYILVFQTDSCLCRPIDETIVDSYGYIGAPSKLYPSTWQNGGLSLRNRELMIQAIKDKKSDDSTWPEDRYFSVLKKHITNPAPYEQAKNFSVEQFYSDKPFGIHKAWVYLKPNLWRKLKENNPEINLVFNF